MQELLEGAKSLISMDCVDCRTKLAYIGSIGKFRNANVPPFRHNGALELLQDWIRLCRFVARATNFARYCVEQAPPRAPSWLIRVAPFFLHFLLFWCHFAYRVIIGV